MSTPDFDDEYVSFLHNPYDHIAAPSSTKRYRNDLSCNEQSVFTFSVPSFQAEIQLLSDHTLEHVVEAMWNLCGFGDGVGVHLWNFRVNGVTYEDGPTDPFANVEPAQGQTLRGLGLARGDMLVLTYDYSSTYCYTTRTRVLRFFLGGIERAEAEMNLKEFPRKKPATAVSGYVKFTTDAVDLNAACPVFSEWAFGLHNRTEINFGRARNGFFGFFVSEGHSVDSIYLPDEAASLEHYLSSLEHACKSFPEETERTRRSCHVFNYECDELNRLTRNRTSGFLRSFAEVCDETIAFGVNLATIYPKIAALLGKMKDNYVKRGRITYKNDIMSVIGPTARPPLVLAQRRVAAIRSYAGQDLYAPKTEEGVLMCMKVKVRSLQEFFGVAEGLLRTLG